MKKVAIRTAVIASFLAFSSCSTYNSIMPDWAKVGSSEPQVEAKVSEDNAESTWWNPLTWW